MSEAAQYVRSLGLSWSGPYPSSPYKMAKIAGLAGDSILDVGCGAGAYVAFCQRLGKRARGIDLDAGRLGQAVSGFGPAFSRASAAGLPFADKTFATVLMWDVLEHTEDDRLALSEAMRVAEQNVLLSVPKQDSERLFSSAIGLTYRHYIDPAHVRYYTPERIAKLADSLGASQVVVEHWCRIFPVAVYRGAGVPRLLTAALDRFLWVLIRDKRVFLRNLFAEILL